MSWMRRDPFHDVMHLRDSMNGLIGESFVRPRAGLMAMTGSVPVDVKETADSYVLLMPLPGIDPSDVDIAVLGSSVRVSGEFRQPPPDEDSTARWLVRERRFGHFERSITLPTSVSAERTTAEFEAGILTVRLPKAEEAKPRSIPIRASEPPESPDSPESI